MKTILKCAAALTLCCAPATAFATTEGYTALFDGSSLAGWQVDPAHVANFQVQNGLLKVSGQGGWLRSARQYSNYTLRVELRYLTEDPSGGRVGISGLFLRASEANAGSSGWPQRAAEVQLGNRTGLRPALPGDARWTGAILRHGLEGGPTTYNTEAALRAHRGTGEWQTVEVQVLGDVATVLINGHFIGRASMGADPQGFIGIQAESGEVEFRAIEIREGVGAPFTPAGEGWTRLIVGTSLAGWAPANPASRTFTAENGGIRVTGRADRGGTSPNVCMGNLMSANEYADFVIRFQARFESPISDSGFLLRVPPPTNPPTPGGGRAYQVQLQAQGDRELPWNGSLFRQGDVPQGETTFDFAAANRSYSPVGEWTNYEIEAYKTWITVRVNGVVVSTAENVGVPSGLLGIQCEVGNVDIRNMEIREIGAPTT